MNIWYFCMDAHIASNTHQYAPSIHVTETIDALRRQGHRVACFFATDEMRRNGWSFASAQGIAGSRKRIRSDWARAMGRDVYELYRNLPERRLVESIFRAQSIDMAYERLAQNKWSVSQCSSKYRIPLLVESNAPVDERRQYWGAPLEALSRDVEKQNLRRADALIVVSTPLKWHYEKLGMPIERIFVLPNGVNETVFSAEQVQQRVRPNLKLDQKIVIGFVGNVHKYHGLELLLPLARRLKQSSCDFHFLVVGGTERLNLLESALAADGMEHHFTFVGSIPNDQVPEYVAAMDICILPHFMWYGSPMKVLEYGVMGKAIVAPDMENIRDILTHRETALLFEAGNVAAMADAVHELANNESLRVRVGSAARTHILKNHTWTRNAERIEQIYSMICSGSLGVRR